MVTEVSKKRRSILFDSETKFEISSEGVGLWKIKFSS